MGFLVSPGVEIKEIDLTNVIPAVSTSIGGFAGYFRWGPVEEIKLLGSEQEMVTIFGKPDALTAESFFTAASFLKYGNALKVVRASDEAGAGGILVNAAASEEIFGDVLDDNTGALTFTTTTVYVLLSSGISAVDDTYNGNSITINGETVLIADYDATTTPGYAEITLATALTAAPANGDSFSINVADAPALIKNEDEFSILTALTGDIYARYAGELGNSLQVELIDSTTWATSTNADEFDSAPVGDEIHVIVIDEDGAFGTVGAILERWSFLQTTEGARTDQGANNYFKDAINNNSNWIYINDETVAPGVYSLTGGVDIDAAGIAEEGNIVTALEELDDAEQIDLSLLFSITDADGSNVISNKVHEIAYTRKDVVGFISPPVADSTGNDPLTDVLDWAAGITVRDSDGSYGFADSTAAYVYDKYNDKFRWIGSSGITAGLAANTDEVAEPWFSPAGFNRGSVRGVVKFAYLPRKNDRDELYKAGINFFKSETGLGVVLFGDKTLQGRPSAFDRINVRRLFIVLEKAIATASKFQLFELNDEFTRAIFVNLVEPFLRDVRGRRGLTDFFVVCDESNNTGDIIDTNRFVADIYIKPSRSINFITLNFIATRTGVEFAEIIGTN